MAFGFSSRLNRSHHFKGPRYGHRGEYRSTLTRFRRGKSPAAPIIGEWVKRQMVFIRWLCVPRSRFFLLRFLPVVRSLFRSPFIIMFMMRPPWCSLFRPTHGLDIFHHAKALVLLLTINSICITECASNAQHGQKRPNTLGSPESPKTRQNVMVLCRSLLRAFRLCIMYYTILVPIVRLLLLLAYFGAMRSARCFCVCISRYFINMYMEQIVLYIGLAPRFTPVNVCHSPSLTQCQSVPFFPPLVHSIFVNCGTAIDSSNVHKV